jgi:DNA-binding transcriptional LysR family regulator
METRDWMILKVLYEERNITKTAELLYVSQPAMTKRLQQIEQEFNVEVVRRNKHGVDFTPQGECLAKYANKILKELEDIRIHLDDMAENVEGTLRIGASNFITRHRLPKLLGEFKRLYPKVEFEVQNGWSNDIFNMVSSRAVQVAFVRGDYNWQNQKELYLEESICVISAQPIKFTDLQFLPRIEYKKDYKLNEIINNWWWEHFDVCPKVAMTVNRSDICREMVTEGLGYAILPSLVVENDHNLYRWNLTDKTGKVINRKAWLLYHQDMTNLKIVRAFIDFVKLHKAGKII